MADDPVADAEKAVVQFSHDQFVALMAAVQPKASVVSKVVAEAEAVGKAAVADVKAINWSHVAAFLMSAAALAMHFIKYLP